VIYLKEIEFNKKNEVFYQESGRKKQKKYCIGVKNDYGFLYFEQTNSLDVFVEFHKNIQGAYKFSSLSQTKRVIKELKGLIKTDFDLYSDKDLKNINYEIFEVNIEYSYKRVGD
jgi:hypothetical protein